MYNLTLKEIYLYKDDSFVKISRVFFTNTDCGYIPLSLKINIIFFFYIVFLLTVKIIIRYLFKKIKKLEKSNITEME